MLVDQEFAILTIVVAAALLIPWLVGHPGAAQFRAAVIAAVAAVVVASPQLVAMARQALAGGYQPPPSKNYVRFAAELPSLFAPSTRLAHYGLGGLASIYRQHTTGESLATFGIVLTDYRFAVPAACLALGGLQAALPRLRVFGVALALFTIAHNGDDRHGREIGRLSRDCCRYEKRQRKRSENRRCPAPEENAVPQP